MNLKTIFPLVMAAGLLFSAGCSCICGDEIVIKDKTSTQIGTFDGDGREILLRVSGEADGMGRIVVKSEKLIFGDMSNRELPMNSFPGYHPFSFEIPVIPVSGIHAEVRAIAKRGDLKLRNVKTEIVTGPSTYTPETVIPDTKKLGTGSHRRHKAQFDKNHPEIILFGDSLTDNWRGKRWEPMAKKFNILNAGICGDTIQGQLARMNDLDLEQFPPKTAIILIGINNTGSKTAVSDIVTGIVNLARTLHRRSPQTRITIVALTPNGLCGPSLYPSVALINAGLKKRIYDLALNEKECCYDLIDLTGTLSTPEGTVRKDLYESDNLHFNDKCYAEIIMPAYERKIRESAAIPASVDHIFNLWYAYLIRRAEVSAANMDGEAYNCAIVNLQNAKNEWKSMSDSAVAGKPVKIVLPSELLRQEKEEGLPPELIPPSLLQAAKIAAGVR